MFMKRKNSLVDGLTKLVAQRKMDQNSHKDGIKEKITDQTLLNKMKREYKYMQTKKAKILLSKAAFQNTTPASANDSKVESIKSVA